MQLGPRLIIPYGRSERFQSSDRFPQLEKAYSFRSQIALFGVTQLLIVQELGNDGCDTRLRLRTVHVDENVWFGRTASAHLISIGSV